MNRANIDEMNFVPLQELKPGKYLLQVRVKIGDEDWRKQMAELEINILPPFWQTWWFWILTLGCTATGSIFLIIMEDQ